MESDLVLLKELLGTLIGDLQKDSRTYDSYYIDLEQITHLNKSLADILHEQSARNSQSVSQARNRIDTVNEQSGFISSSIDDSDKNSREAFNHPLKATPP